MKHQLAAVAFSSVVACGASSARADAHATLRRQAIIPQNSIAITQLEAGSSVNEFALEVKASVTLASNPCRAAGLDARLVVATVDGTIRVTAYRMIPLEAIFRACTQDYNPVTKSLSVTVRGKADLVSDVIIANVNEYRNDVSAFAFFGGETYEAILDQVKVTRLEPHGYKVAGRVELGANPCAARGVKALFEVRNEGDERHLVALLREPPDARTRICTMEYNPVYAQLTREIRLLTPAAVIVENVNELGRDVDAADLSSE